MNRATRIGVWILGSIFAIAVVYVAYSHIASIATAKAYLEEPTAYRFDSEAAISQTLTVKQEGATHSVAGGVLSIAGSGSLALSSRERALKESILTMRFKTPANASFDVFMGLESDHSGAGKKSLSYILHGDKEKPQYGWEGSELAPMAGIVVKGLPGEDLDSKERYPFDGPTEWHELQLAISTSVHRVTAFVDGVPTGSIRSEWLTGLPFHIVFGARSREPGAPIDVAIEKVTWEPRPGEALALDWTDEFNGKVIDPKRWSVFSLDSDVIEASVKSTPKGLLATAHGTPRVVRASPSFLLDTPSFPLSSVKAKARVRVTKMQHAAFFFGVVSALGGPHLRFFDVGFHDTEDRGKHELVGSVAGHWGRDAQVRSEPPKHWADSDVITVEYIFDVKTRVGVAKMDGHVIGEHVLDLQPREHARIRMGAVVDSPSSNYELVVESVTVSALQD